MGNIINNKQKIQFALAGFFNDPSDFLDEIAKEVYTLGSVDEIKYEFFEVIVPVCYDGLLALPVAWFFYEEETLFKEIEEYQNLLQTSLWQRIRHKLRVKFCKILYASVWIELEKEILKLQK